MQVEYVLSQPADCKALQHKRIPRWGLVGDQRVGRLDAELRLGGAGRRAAPQPGQLLSHQVAPTRLGPRDDSHPLGAGQYVGRIPAVIAVDGAVVHLPRPRAHLVEEPPVVAHHHQRLSPPSGQVASQPTDRLDVEVVGRLVEHQDVMPGQQHRDQRGAAALTAAERADRRIQIDACQQVLDDSPGVRLARPHMVGASADDELAHGVLGGEVVGLAQIANRQACRVRDPAVVGGLHAGQHLEQRRFPVAVTSDHPDRVAFVDAEADRIQQRAGAVGDGDALRIDQVGHQPSMICSDVPE